jgi:hypothetical protein
MVAASVRDIGIVEELVGVEPVVVDRLAEYFVDVASGLVRSEQRWAAEYYARALMMDGARKSLEPMVARMGGTSVEYEAIDCRAQDDDGYGPPQNCSASRHPGPVPGSSLSVGHPRATQPSSTAGAGR